MKKNIFAVCDPEPEYAGNLLNFLNRTHRLPFSVQVFTSLDHLILYAKENPIELLLISSKLLDARLRQLQIGKIVVLSEGTVEEEWQESTSVYKYQSGTAVLQETLAAYSENRDETPRVLPVGKKKQTRYGIYSPIGRCLKTSFALAIGQEKARSGGTLYINLEGNSGLGKLMGRSFVHTLSDVLYFARQQDPNLIHRINGIIQTVNHLDFIPPVNLSSDIFQAGWKDWEYLIRVLSSQSSYETLVLDIGNDTENAIELMKACDYVFMPILNDTISLAKLSQFESMLHIWEEENLMNRITKVCLPQQMVILPADTYVERLLYSEIGDIARELLSQIPFIIA
ncbi:MAG: hypothetical protein IKE58_02235 [Blautia sp.]|nr:hypothetical protein [Blautia sp.]